MIEYYMFGDTTEFFDGLGIILINFLMLEQMHRMHAEENGRKGDWVVYTLLALCVMVTFMQFLYGKGHSLWWSVPVNAAVLFTFALLAERTKVILAGRRTVGILLLFGMTILMANHMKITENGLCVMLNYAVLYFLLFLGSSWLSQKRKLLLTKKEMVILLLSAALSIGILYYLLSLAGRIEHTVALYGCIAGILGIDGILMYLFVKTKEGQKKEQQCVVLEQQNALQKQYMQSIYEMDDQARRIRHDLQHHLDSLNALIRQKNPDMEEISRYLSAYEQQTMLLQESVHTDSSVVNAVLNAKLLLCKERGIQTTVCVEKILRAISEVDLCSLLGNLLDNAIEAEQKLPLTERRIEIQIQSSEAVMDIWVKNAITESVLKKNRALHTTKADTKQHGFGTKIIQRIADKYEGYLDIYEEEGCFCCHIQI